MLQERIIYVGHDIRISMHNFHKPEFSIRLFIYQLFVYLTV